jgi:16S rRNA (uracil1498-N3)-methyltransferase
MFYTPEIEGEYVTLSESESGHCARVLRMRNGDSIDLTDGKGNFYRAVITHLHPKHCELKILEKTKVAPIRNCRLHMAVAPVKNFDRFEIFVEKATEIGIDELTLLRTRYSERKETKTERIEKVILAAAKQSQKAYFPLLNPTVSLNDFFKRDFEGQKFIAHCGEGEKIHLKNALKPSSDALILIGPEGDFSQEEVEAAKKAGFIEVSLSDSRLRTETAALLAVAIFDFVNVV